VGIALNGVRAVFHRPHPEKETDKGALRAMRDFLTSAGGDAMMEYKGYVGKVEFDAEAGIFHGRVVGHSGRHPRFRVKRSLG